MTTKFAKPLEASQLTHVKDMPPLEVVTEGIPAQEHMDVPPPVPLEAAHAEPERRGWAFAWALAGVVGFLVVVAGAFALTQYSSSDLTPPAWQESRTDERAAESVYSGPLLGAARPYAPYLSIPSIASIPDMSIPSIPSISIPSFPAIPAVSIPSISIPSFPQIPPIPPISIPEIPAFPAIPDM